MATRTAPTPAPEPSAEDTAPEFQVPTVEESVAAAEAAVAPLVYTPSTHYFKSVAGFTDGSNFHGDGDYFIATDTVLDHFARTGGKDGQRTLYYEVPESEYRADEEARALAIRTEAQELPTPTPINQVVNNGMASSNGSA